MSYHGTRGSRLPRGRFLSVGLKLATTTGAVVAILATGVYFSLSHLERQNLMAAKEAAAAMVARLYVATAVAPLTFGDEVGVTDAVALLAANDDIVYAAAWAVTDDLQRLGSRLGELRRGAAIAPPSRIPLGLEVRRDARTLIVDAPVTDPTRKVVGVVRVAFSLEKERVTLARMEQRTLGAAIGVSAFLTVLLLLFARHVIVRPLARLASAAKALEEGVATTVEIRANDEIGRLATAFIAMRDAIEQREKRIAERNRDLRQVLDNVEDGFLAVTAAGSMSHECSRILEQWFGPPAAKATVFEYFDQVAGAKFGEWLRFAWESLSDSLMPIELLVEQLPCSFDRDGRFYSVIYRPILKPEGETLKAMLVVIRDVTERVERERTELIQREMLTIFKHVLSDRTRFDGFFSNATNLVNSIEHADELDDRTLMRQIHTLKGNAAFYGLERVPSYCHELESRMVEEKTRPTAAQVTALRSIWNGIADTYKEFSNDDAGQITIHEDEQRALLLAIERGAEAQHLATVVTSWGYERAVARMTAVGQQVKQLARRLGKGEVDIRIQETRLRLPPERWLGFWGVFGHVVRNAVDHGLEVPSKRLELGKPERGAISMSFEECDDSVVFRFTDDGAGIDWNRLTTKAVERGLSVNTHDDLVGALFTDSISTCDEVTDISGRGVGMGAVLECVTSCGGRIDLETTRGIGTTWVFTFPQTMLCSDEVVGRQTPPMNSMTLLSTANRSSKIV